MSTLSRVEAVEEVVDVGIDEVAVGVHLVEYFRVGLRLAETAHLQIKKTKNKKRVTITPTGHAINSAHSSLRVFFL